MTELQFWGDGLMRRAPVAVAADERPNERRLPAVEDPGECADVAIDPACLACQCGGGCMNCRPTEPAIRVEVE